MLGRREYSVHELGQRLLQKWPALDSTLAADLLSALVEENLLSDARFAESFVRSQIQRSNGPLKIRAALRARGVSDALIAAELSQRDHEWLALAQEWLERQRRGELDYAARGKYYRRLLNRGFTHEQAMGAINSLS